jgi:hypothetical protein
MQRHSFALGHYHRDRCTRAPHPFCEGGATVAEISSAVLVHTNGLARPLVIST